MFFIVPVILGWLCFAVMFISYLKNKKLPLILSSVLAILFVCAFTVWGVYLR